MAQRLGEQIKKRFPIISAVIGAKDLSSFPKIVRSLISLPVHQEKTLNDAKVISAYTTIMRGCENFCSYCVVPYVRGPEKSRKASEIIAEIKRLAKNGAKEIMLLGQNVNSYKSTGYDFPKLLSKINEIPGILRIRFMTSHPKDLSDKLISKMAALKKVCRHLHLPLQSGSDKILKAMNRKYKIKDYTKLVNKLRSKIPDINITTDIIVGFPGETKKDFNATIQAIQNIHFGAIFAFKYSPRPNTKAEKLKDDVNIKEKDYRISKVIEISNMISKSKNDRLIGTMQEILVQEKDGKRYCGLTSCSRKVFFDSAKDVLGQILNIKITSAGANSLVGEIQPK
jgi:tRNA-2-methylthio-N6-dimethylallyladenosine synthase